MGFDASRGAPIRKAPRDPVGALALPHLTSLRFFAAFWVLGFHALPRSGLAPAWAAFWNAGWLGVTFFFVLSGFILTYTYGRHAGRFDRRGFWVARFARVYPLYLFAMLFAIPQLAHDVRHPAATATLVDTPRLAGVVVSSLAMVQAWFGSLSCVWNCPSWSLSDEAFFYALFPLIVPLTARRDGRWSVLAVALAGMALIAAGASGTLESTVAIAAAGASLHPVARLPEFLVGAWLGGLFVARRPIWPRGGFVAATAAGAIAVLGAWAGLHPAFHAPHLLSVPLFATLVYAVASSPDPRRGLLAAGPMVLLGEASYALYMLHGPLHGYVLAAFNRAAPGAPAWFVFLAYTGVALCLALASFRWLERPARVWLRTRLAATPVATSTS